jgi:hypothetical protein
MPYKTKTAIIVPAAGPILGAGSSSGGSRTAYHEGQRANQVGHHLERLHKFVEPDGRDASPDALDGINAAVLQGNANGGIQRHTAKLVTCDTQTKSNLGSDRLTIHGCMECGSVSLSHVGHV